MLIKELTETLKIETPYPTQSINLKK